MSRPRAVPNVFDIEAIPTDERGRRSRRPATDARHEFLVGATWADPESEPRFWPSRARMWRYLLATGGAWYGHNAGHYDTLFFLPDLLRNRAKFRCQQSRIISAECGELSLRDSVKILPASVAEIGRALGLPKLERCGDPGHTTPCAACEAGYREARDDDDTRRYLARDCEIVREGLRRARALMGLDELPSTLAAYGIGRVEEQGHAPLVSWSDVGPGAPVFAAVQRSERFRPWVAGGRVEIFVPRLPAGYIADVHSHYTRSTFDGLPGAPSPRGPLSLYRARVRVPATDIPPLPYRHEERLYFPTGEWVGHFCEPEIEAASTVRGIRIEILERHRFTRCMAAAECAHEWWARRENASGFERLFWKCLLNWTWGKFSEHPEREEMVCSEDALPGWREYSRTHGLFLAPTLSIPKLAHCAAGAWIPSHGRARLWRALVANDPAMCDTDCIGSARKPRVDYGPGCGQWELERDPITGRTRHENCISPAPKIYAWGGKTRAKGFSGVRGFAGRAARSDVEALARGESLELWGLVKLRGRIKKGGDSLPLVSRMRKALHLEDGARPKRAENGARPWTIDEINS